MSLQVIQTIRAMDRDNFANGRFSFALPADVRANPNFTLKDNEGMKVRNQSSQFTKNMDSQLDHTFSHILIEVERLYSVNTKFSPIFLPNLVAC